MRKLILLLLLPAFCMGQDRVNRPDILFENKSSILKNATGWSYNTELGEWIDYKNVISDKKRYKTTFKELEGSAQMMSKEDQNFEYLQFKFLKTNKDSYYILTLKKWNGGYEYPSIKKGWRVWSEVIGFIFSKEEYLKLLNNVGLLKLSTKKLVSLGINEDCNESIFLDKIQSKIYKNENKYSPLYIFPVLKTKNNGINVVRFLIPKWYSKKEKYDFNNYYFESSEDDFNKLLINSPITK